MIKAKHKHLAISFSVIALLFSSFVIFHFIDHRVLDIETGRQVAQVGGESKTYYIDATSGNDSNTGLSAELAWKTIAKVITYDADGKITLDGNVYDPSTKMRKNGGFYLRC